MVGAYAILFAYVGYAVNSDHTDIGHLFVYPPAFILLFGSIFGTLSFVPTIQIEYRKVWKVFAPPVVILSTTAIIFPFWMFNQGYLLSYDVWTERQMPPKPVDSNLSMVFYLFVSVLLSVVPLIMSAILSLKSKGEQDIAPSDR